jgi:anti-sigma B factor antagonist
MSSFEVVSGVPVVAAPEEIDVTNADALRWALLEAAAHGHGTLVVDMTATRFCDSSGLHTLLAAHNHAQSEGGELLLVIPDIVRFRIFQITGVDRVIHRVASLDQALAQTSADGLGALRRVDGTPHGSDRHGLPAQRGTSELAGEAR